MKTYYVHTVANQFRTLYIGVTGKREVRAEESSRRDSSLRSGWHARRFFSNLLLL